MVVEHHSRDKDLTKAHGQLLPLKWFVVAHAYEVFLDPGTVHFGIEEGAVGTMGVQGF